MVDDAFVPTIEVVRTGRIVRSLCDPSQFADLGMTRALALDAEAVAKIGEDWIKPRSRPSPEVEPPAVPAERAKAAHAQGLAGAATSAEAARAFDDLEARTRVSPTHAPARKPREGLRCRSRGHWRQRSIRPTPKARYERERDAVDLVGLFLIPR
jgi:hypothetical protein